MEQVATRIASFGAASPPGLGVDTVDVSAEMVELLSARGLASVNLQILRTGHGIRGATVDGRGWLAGSPLGQRPGGST